MKTTVKQLATGTFIALLLMVLNVNAEGTETNSSVTESIETSLQLEEWMINETIWDTNSAWYSDFVLETETQLNIENWMTDSKVWDFDYPEQDPGLELAAWMMDKTLWE